MSCEACGKDLDKLQDNIRVLKKLIVHMINYRPELKGLVSTFLSDCEHLLGWEASFIDACSDPEVFLNYLISEKCPMKLAE